MKYEIKRDIPLPRRVGSHRLRSPESHMMKDMQPGDFFLITEASRVNAARCAVRTLGLTGKVLIAKMEDGTGWGVWRQE